MDTITQINQNKNWYVLYVQGGKEAFLKNALNKYEDMVVFIPMIERVFKIQGEYKETMKVMFPGYLFIKTDKDQKEVEALFQEVKSRIKGFRKMLKFDKEGTSILRKEEILFLEDMLDEKYVLRMSKGKIIQDVLLIEEGPLCGKESWIRKIDRHKCIAYLEVKMLGRNVIAGMAIREKE